MPFSSGKIFQRFGARAATRNLSWLIAERLGRLGCNVVVGFVVARHLGPAQFGTLSYAFALVAIGAAVAEGGVANIVRRELVAEPGRTGAVLAAAWKLRLLAGAACYAVVGWWSAWSDPAERGLLLIGGLLLFQPALAVSDLWLQARLESRLATLAQFAALAVGAAVRLALVGADAPLWTFAAAAVGEAAIAVALLNRFARGHGRPAHAAIDREAITRLWGESWPLLLSGLTVILYIRLDLVMVRQIAGEPAAGAYAAAVRLSELGFFLPGAIVTSLLPAVLQARAAGAAPYRVAMQRLMDVNAGLAYALAVPMVLLAPWVVRLAYGAQFAAAGPVLAVHGWTLVWAALGVVRGQFCVNEGLTRLHLASTAAGAVLNVGLNLVLIPRYGAVGAAWATLATQATAAWVSSFCFARTRECAGMQTRALLIPVRWFHYVRSPS